MFIDLIKLPMLALFFIFTVLAILKQRLACVVFVFGLAFQQWIFINMYVHFIYITTSIFCISLIINSRPNHAGMSKLDKLVFIAMILALALRLLGLEDNFFRFIKVFFELLLPFIVYFVVS